MSLINVSNLTFAYEGSHENIFEDVSFRLDTAWKLGFTGRNGRGKTTFLKLLLGQLEYSGVISAVVDFEYFPFEVPDMEKNALENIRTLRPDTPEWEIERELSLLEVPEETLLRPFKTLSNGEKTKVLLSALFLNENGFPLIDEPTNHLDTHGREVLARYLNGKRGFILVSHDRALLDACIDHVLAINKTNIEVRRGNFSAWLEDKEARDRGEMRENEKLKKETQRLAASAERSAGFSDKTEKSKYGSKNSGLRVDRGYVGHKSAKMMKRSKSIEARNQAALEEKSKLLKNLENTEDLKITQIPYHSNRLAELRDVSVFYGDKEVCRNVTFSISQGERIALIGPNGSGKSSVLKLLLGEHSEYTGELHTGSRLALSHVPQDAEFLTGGLFDYAAENNIDETLLLSILRKLDFPRSLLHGDMRFFSGGQKKKVLIAKSLCEKSHLLVWDEPLNFIDVYSRIQIEKLLFEHQPTLIFVEHDRTFCDKIATKRVHLG